MTDDEALDRVMNPAREPVSARHPQRVVSLAADARAAPRELRVREAPEPHRRFAGSAPPHGARVAAADDVRRHVAARLHHAAADRRQPARAGRVRLRDAGGVDGEEPAARSSACRSSSRSTCCRTPRRCASSSRARCSRCCTSGRCAPASTRRRRSTWRRWTRSSRCARVHPRIGRHIGPPCVIRNGLISPRCTEGSHFCGVPVWRDFPAVGPPALDRDPRLARLTSTPPAAPCSRFSPREPHLRATDYRDAFFWLCLADRRRCHRRRARAPRRVASACPGSTARSSTTSSTT